MLSRTRYSSLIDDFKPPPSSAQQVTAGRDFVQLDKLANEIDALGGNDVVLAGDNPADTLDIIHGGNGHDIIFGEGGEDHLSGDNGHDILLAGAGSDHVLDGGAGNDILVGLSAHGTTFFGGTGRDQMHGNTEGIDFFAFRHANESGAGNEADQIFNWSNIDYLSFSTLDGNQSVDGMQHFDWLGHIQEGETPGIAEVGYYHADGSTWVIGNNGEVFEIELVGQTVDIYGNIYNVDFGDGAGPLQSGNEAYISLSANVISSSGKTSASADIGDLVYDPVAKPKGTDGQDIVQLDDGSNIYNALGGDDIVMAGGNSAKSLADIISGGDGDDILFGEAGFDKLYGDDGNDILLGGSGNDWLIGGLGRDDMFGGVTDADKFIWRSQDETGMGSLADRIFNFETGDLLDFSRMDANLDIEGNQDFDWVGEVSQGGELDIGTAGYYHTGDDTRILLNNGVSFEVEIVDKVVVVAESAIIA